jgi:hypothetical protein
MTLAVLRTFVETDLADAALQVILSAAEEDITEAVGADTTMVELRDAHGESVLWLARSCATMGAITETDDGGTVVTLDATDYELDTANNRRIERIGDDTATHPASGWTGRVSLTYAPGDLNRRNRAIAQLVELDLAFRPGAKSENIGDHSRSMQDYDAERARIISQAQSRRMA